MLRMPLLFQSSITNVGIMQKCEQSRTNIIIVSNSTIHNVCAFFPFLKKINVFFLLKYCEPPRTRRISGLKSQVLKPTLS